LGSEVGKILGIGYKVHTENKVGEKIYVQNSVIKISRCNIEKKHA